jgi:toxin-antitoxin system PIN domain toxin
LILVDANLLLYAYVSSSVHHQQARVWFETVIAEQRPMRLAWITIVAFLRLATHSRVFERPFSMAEACRVVEGWLARPAVAILSPGERHWSILSRLLHEAQARGDVTTDAHLAALAIEHGATLYTTDRDFVRFRALRLENPLEPTG